MTVTHNDFWWPLDLSAREDEAFDAFRLKMRETPVSLDTESLSSVSDLLAQVMRQHIDAIVARDSLPHLGHILNGWGNVKYQSRPLTRFISDFIHRDDHGLPFIRQCDPEGEVHPWQNFAYAIMAGVSPDVPVGRDLTLRTLAQNSRYLQTSEGRELGHLLFSLAYLDTSLDDPPFSLLGQVCDIRTLVDLAVEAHHYGSFEVCRKFHLTEGLCAVAAKIPGLENYRDDAQAFLDGQLDMLLLLGVILERARELETAGKPAEPGSLIEELRDTLVIESYLENHCYYAGHIIELGMFAESLGYRILPEHQNAMVFVANELNRTLPAFLPFACFTECFLHLGHYRRAITLLAEMERVRREGSSLSAADLAKFTIDLDHVSPRAEAALAFAASQPAPMRNGIYNLAMSESMATPHFVQVVACYNSLAPSHFALRGNADHYRRVMPRDWPRALHYELLDYGSMIGAELHLENPECAWLRESVQMQSRKVAEHFPNATVEWDPEWLELGRVRILFNNDVQPETVAAGMLTLIEKTYSELDTALKNYRRG